MPRSADGSGRALLVRDDGNGTIRRIVDRDGRCEIALDRSFSNCGDLVDNAMMVKNGFICGSKHARR